jgi:hypothetical protein
MFISNQILVGIEVCHLAFMCVQDAQRRGFMNLTLGLCLYDYVRHGRTKIISTKPLAPELAGGLFGG